MTRNVLEFEAAMELVRRTADSEFGDLSENRLGFETGLDLETKALIKGTAMEIEERQSPYWVLESPKSHYRL